MTLGKWCAGLAAVAGSLVAASAAEAAKLAEIHGDVLVSRGGGYQATIDATELNSGDSVIAGIGGGAKITFADGCVLSLEPGTVVTISEKSPCAGKGAPIETGATGESSGSSGAGNGAPIETGSTGTNGHSTTTYVVGGLVIGGAIAAAVVLSDDDDDNNGEMAGAAMMMREAQTAPVSP